MNRPTLLILVTASAIMWHHSSTHAAESVGRRPNLVILLADQLRYQSVGYAGDARALTPNIDRLASQGVNFHNFVANTPVCAAYRASLWTGKYASSTGMVVNELRINPNQRCLGHVLTEHGYQTGYIGKWHLWSNVAGSHREIENAFTPPGRYRLGFDGYWAAYNFNHDNYRAWYFLDTPQPHRIKGYGPDHFTNLAIDFLEHRDSTDDPFALVVSFSPPHDPWTQKNVPAEWYEKFKNIAFPNPATWEDTPDPRMDRNAEPDRWRSYWKAHLEEFMRVYYAMTANLDWNVGRILDAIDEHELADDTIVMFSSDHGEMFGAHGRIFKMTFYEEAIRVPMLLRWPGRIPAGHVSDACMATPDILPTLLSLMDLPVPREVEGMDVSHLAQGQPGDEPEFAFLQGMGHTYQWKDGFEWRGLRDKRFTYAVYRSDRRELLFDNVADPNQAVDLSDDPKHQDTRDRLRTALQRRMAELNDTFEACSWYRDHWTEDRHILRGAKGPFTATTHQGP